MKTKEPQNLTELLTLELSRTTIWTSFFGALRL